MTKPIPIISPEMFVDDEEGMATIQNFKENPTNCGSVAADVLANF